MKKSNLHEQLLKELQVTPKMIKEYQNSEVDPYTKYENEVESEEDELLAFWLKNNPTKTEDDYFEISEKMDLENYENYASERKNRLDREYELWKNLRNKKNKN